MICMYDGQYDYILREIDHMIYHRAICAVILPCLYMYGHMVLRHLMDLVGRDSLGDLYLDSHIS